MARVISLGELLRWLEEGRVFTLIEVLAPEEYRRGHIPRAINIPLERLGMEARLRFAREHPLVVYCLGPKCKAAELAARKLGALGFTEVWIYPGGKEEWTNAKLPLRTGPDP